MRVCIAGPDLPLPIVQMAFEYALQRDVPLAAFLGDDTVTLKMHPELEVQPCLSCSADNDLCRAQPCQSLDNASEH